MNLIQRFLLINIVAVNVLLLTGCQQQQEDTYTSFMLHPKKLLAALKRCQIAPIAYCEEAQQAADDFDSLVKERINQPEAFGQKIMREQLDLVKLHQAYQQAKQANNAATLQEAKRAYRLQREKIDTFYAVIVATSQGPLADD